MLCNWNNSQEHRWQKTYILTTNRTDSLQYTALIAAYIATRRQQFLMHFSSFSCSVFISFLSLFSVLDSISDRILTTLKFLTYLSSFSNNVFHQNSFSFLVFASFLTRSCNDEIWQVVVVDFFAKHSLLITVFLLKMFYRISHSSI